MLEEKEAILEGEWSISILDNGLTDVRVGDINWNFSLSNDDNIFGRKRSGTKTAEMYLRLLLE